MSDIEKRAFSLTENLIRRDLELRDLIDSCTELYQHYGKIKIVVEETGLPLGKVRDYIKYPRLIAPLKKWLMMEILG